MTQSGLAPMGMFELAPVGIPIAVAGIIYMITIGQRSIPDRYQPNEDDLNAALRPYLTEILIQPSFPPRRSNAGRSQFRQSHGTYGCTHRPR